MSCILRAVQNGENLPTGAGGTTIYNVYTSSRGKSHSVQAWIRAQRAHRKKNGTAEFYLFDEAEDEFLKAMAAGVSISEGQVRGLCLHGPNKEHRKPVIVESLSRPCETLTVAIG